MKAYRARYTPEAAQRIRTLHPQIKAEVKMGIRALLEKPLVGYPLHFDLAGYWSYRVRMHRIIYRMNDDDRMLDIVFVGPRRTVYEELRTLLVDPSRRN